MAFGEYKIAGIGYERPSDTSSRVIVEPYRHFGKYASGVEHEDIDNIASAYYQTVIPYFSPSPKRGLLFSTVPMLASIAMAIVSAIVIVTSFIILQPINAYLVSVMATLGFIVIVLMVSATFFSKKL